MTKEADQTQETEDQDAQVAVMETDDEDTSIQKAVKTSEEFDKLADSEGTDVEETPSKPEDDKADDKEPEDKGAEDKDTGDEDTDDSEQQQADTKDATDTGEARISKELAQKAIDLGLTEEEVLTGFATEEDLQKTIGIIESVTAAAEGEAADTQAADTGAAEDAKGFEFEFENKDDIDPELMANIEKMRDHYEATVKKLSEKVDGIVDGVAQERKREFVKRFDGMIDGLGLEFVDTFGKGQTASLPNTSRAFTNRDAVRAHMHAFAKGMVESGLEIPDEQTLFDLAINSLHKQKLENVKGSRMLKKTTARSKQRIGRASTRKTGSLTPHQKALETNRKFDELIDTSED